jgi:hypothetical protein
VGNWKALALKSFKMWIGGLHCQISFPYHVWNAVNCPATSATFITLLKVVEGVRQVMREKGESTSKHPSNHVDAQAALP